MTIRKSFCSNSVIEKFVSTSLALGMFISLGTATAADSVAHYLANEALMVVHGETKVMFDPIYKNSYNNYQLVPPEIEAAMFAGTPPYDGLDAIFISHYHGDHFTPEDVMRFLKARDNVEMYAPSQAVVALRAIASDSDQSIFNRVHSVNLEYKDAPISLEVDQLTIDAVRIPHSGWPTGRLDVANIVWRVTLDDETTVVHLGDADANDVHFALDPEFWARKKSDMAFPPYWFFSSGQGLNVLENRISASKNVGIHVPAAMANDSGQRPAELRNVDLFTVPGETRSIPEN